MQAVTRHIARFVLFFQAFRKMLKAYMLPRCGGGPPYIRSNESLREGFFDILLGVISEDFKNK